MIIELCKKKNISLAELARCIGQSPQNFNKKLKHGAVKVEEMISIIESIAQAENQSRSDNIKCVIKPRAASGTLKLYDRKYYGYKHYKSRRLIINEGTVKNVKLIFDLYLGSQSVIEIISELEKRKIFSPTGKEKWCKRTIYVMLSNKTGDVHLLKSGKII